MSGSEGHDVRYDFGGFRVTCTGPGHEQATMRLDDAAFSPEKLKRVNEFFAAHPPINGLVTDADRQGQPARSRSVEWFINEYAESAKHFSHWRPE